MRTSESGHSRASIRKEPACVPSGLPEVTDSMDVITPHRAISIGDGLYLGRFNKFREIRVSLSRSEPAHQLAR